MVAEGCQIHKAGAILTHMLRRLCCLLAAVGLSGCLAAPASPTPPPRALTVTPTAPAAPPTAPATPGNRRLVVWLPPEFAPEAAQPGGTVLAEQLTQFEAGHPGWTVQARSKAAAGPSGLLAALLAAYNVAPAALPDLIALRADDLAAAAAAGAVVALDRWVPREALEDSYPFARAMSLTQNQWAGLAFAADARILVYNTDLYATAPTRWADIVTGTLSLPAAETTGLSVLTDYLAAGGQVLDEAGQPALEAPRLAASLAEWQALQERGVLPLSTLGYAEPVQSWQVFRERRVTLALTTAHWYLTEAGRVSTAAAALPPNRVGAAFTLAEGWCWALVNKGEDLASAAELLNWLASPDRQAAWTLAAGWLPTRAAALTAWGEAPFVPLAAEALTRAQWQPPLRVREQLGPLLRQAIDDVLNGRATPEAAARTVVAALAELPK